MGNFIDDNISHIEEALVRIKSDLVRWRDLPKVVDCNCRKVGANVVYGGDLNSMHIRCTQCSRSTGHLPALDAIKEWNGMNKK